MSKYKSIDLKKIKTYPFSQRRSKVEIANFAKTVRKKGSFQNFFSFSLPDILAGKDFKEFVAAVTSAYKRRKAIIFSFGAHVIKVGVSPLFIDLMKKNLITSLATNGAGAIHDFEIALFGKTSEDVAEGLAKGKFGMARETTRLMNEAIRKGKKEGEGMGEALGKYLLSKKAPFARLSILATGYRLKIPVTVHVALGTDIIHQVPESDGASIGETSLRDFRIFTENVSHLSGGVLVNFGSAVIMPEVFLKAFNTARNLGKRIEDFTVANFDKLQQYRVSQNLLSRPSSCFKGKAYEFIGQHELLIPLLYRALIEKI